ncbi:MAG TPA: hypothetical protein VFE60_13535, partial [Roseiarcus sp.]|nr:hypothetical protein [Roseiarcus sp.]
MIANGSFSSNRNWRPDPSLLRRIKTSYRESIARYEQPAGSMWGIIAERRNDIHQALLEDDDERTAELLGNPSKTELYYGMDIVHAQTVAPLKASEATQTLTKNLVQTHFVAMAESTGARRFWYFEAQGPRSEPTIATIEEMLDSIDKVFGVRLHYPNPFDDEFGVQTSRGIIVARTPMAIYQSWKVALVANLVKGRKILEIGPGTGRSLFYSYSSGLTDFEIGPGTGRSLFYSYSSGLTDYTTIDLPMGIVGQACFLAATLGPERIWMIGDDPATQEGRVRLLPPYVLYESPEDFDVVLNVDSLTEMDPQQSITYLRYAFDHALALISINHEFNAHTFQNLADMAGISQRPLRSVDASTRRKCADSVTALPDFTLPPDPEVHMGGHGLYSTVLDYAKFIRMWLNDGQGPGGRV